jgi:hypothetical protein
MNSPARALLIWHENRERDDERFHANYFGNSKGGSASPKTMTDKPPKVQISGIEAAFLPTR